jgi:hypothetical protein
MLGRAALVNTGDSRENPREFLTLHEGLRADLRPRGKLEELLVERICVVLWRLRRLLASERGYIMRRTIGAHREAIDKMIRKANPAQSLGGLEQLTAGEMEGSSMGIGYLLAYLDGLEQELSGNGNLCAQTAKRVSRFWAGICSRNDPLGLELWRLNSSCIEGSGTGDGCTAAETYRKRMLALIENERTRLLERQEVLQDEEVAMIEAETAMQSVPTEQLIPNLAQHELALDRQLHASLDRLEKLQRARLGDLAYGLARFLATASGSQVRSLKKLALARSRNGTDGSSATSFISRLKLEVK